MPSVHGVDRLCRQMSFTGVEENIHLKLRFFWTFWSIDALLCTIVFIFFIIGLVDGSISSFNIGIWIAIWATLSMIIAGSLLLKAGGYVGFGTLLLSILAIPGILCGLFLFLFIVTDTRWN